MVLINNPPPRYAGGTKNLYIQVKTSKKYDDFERILAYQPLDHNMRGQRWRPRVNKIIAVK